MRIAVIGAGVAGLGAAWALRDAHDVVLFEQNGRLGGHANTVTVDYDGAPIAVDTGFIVFNEHNYPNFTALLAHLGVATIASNMSFSVSDGDGREWSSNGLGGLFAWKRNLANPGFLCMLSDIVRFSAQARMDVQGDTIDAATLADYVKRLGLGRGFLENYLLPMGAAIWSTPEREMLLYPAESFLRFFDNHRLLYAKRPQWRTVAGGSAAYVSALHAALGARVSVGTGVCAVRPCADHVLVRTRDGHAHRFDQAIFACHADEARALLDEGAAGEARAVLAGVQFAPNTAYLHRDAALMPRRRAAWASWNYLRGRGDGGACVTYWMNALQGIDPERPLFVTLNPAQPPRADKTFAAFTYQHPQFDADALAAQRALARLQGRNGLWFAGAWTGNGFHEDGLSSGLAAARALGGAAPWDMPAFAPDAAPLEEAA